jgi:predicted transcriptional regulator
MSEQDKAAVIDLVNRMPASASLRDIAREIEFIAGVREGFEQLDRGEGVPVEEVEQRLKSWTTA